MSLAVDGIETPFAETGDAARGREVFISRDGGHCVLCHSAPGIAVAGNVGPQLYLAWRARDLAAAAPGVRR